MEGLLRFMLGFWDVYKMMSVLFLEKVFENVYVLVVGVGGGFELEVLVNVYFGWMFVGIDFVKEMLNEVYCWLGFLVECIEFYYGFIDSVLEGFFDVVMCFLIIYFLDKDERKKIFSEICGCLKLGVLFVFVYCSFL